MKVTATYITGENSSGNVIWDRNNKKKIDLEIPDSKKQDEEFVEQKIAENVTDQNIKLVHFE
jgi:hypothetical protein